jgi:hypothetical protein
VTQRLFELFGDPGAVWPADRVHEHTGHDTGDPSPVAVWLGRLNAAVTVRNVRTGARSGRVAVEADLNAQTFAGDPEGWPFVIASMPDVEFRIKPYANSVPACKLFASVGDSGFELVLEGLPVEIRLPSGLIGPHPDEPGAPDGSLKVTTGEFTPGQLDDLMVVLRRGEPTSIFVHVRIVVTGAYDFHIQPAVPVSFGRSSLSGIPCRAIHDFRLIPSPEIAPDHFEWLRHPVEPLPSRLTGPYDGLFAVRTVDVDEEAASMRSVVEWLNGHARNWKPTAEFVLDDVVVPFFSPFVLPIPVHLTAGIRRRVLDVGNPSQVHTFEEDPVHIVIREQHKLALNIASFFYRSTPYAQLDDRFLPTKPEFPTAEGWDDPGLTFSAAIVFGEEKTPKLGSDEPQQALTFGVEENLTIVLGYKRDWGTDGLPAPDSGVLGFVNRLLHWEIAGLVIVDIMGFKAGFSPAHKFGEDKSLLDSSLLTADLFVSMPPTGSDYSSFRLRGLDGQKVKFPIEGIGWRLGSFHIEGVALPDGVVLTIYNFSLILSELGLRAEDGASYLSFSGGLGFEAPSGVEVAVTVKGLRFWVAGNPDAPSIKLDGFFLFARGAAFVAEGGGYYRELAEAGGVTGSELGFNVTLTLDFKKRYVFGVDGILGDATGPSGPYDYFMFQAFYVGTIGPLATFEFTGARALYARNMLPFLRDVDREARELRYLKWYRDTNPLTVPGDRRLASWRPDKGSWALGFGASASLPGLGKVIELTVFGLLVRGPTEKGLLVVAEVFALGNTKPFGYAALEIDQHNDRISALIGVDVRLGTFVKSAPRWMDEVGALTGTLFISNDPSTFAIGRLADQSTWLGVRFDVDLWLETALLIGLCFERVEGGPNGFAVTARIEGGIGKKGIVRLSYNAGWTLVAVVFSTGSTDYALRIGIEAGIRFTLFGFLRIGVSASMDFRVVGGHPARGELTAQIKLETPWFLPDVTWRLDFQFGELRPGDLSTAVQPLRSAGALEPASRAQLPTHVERFDPSWDGEGVAPVHSVNELRAPTRPEAQRLANLAADSALRPIATDATIAVTWAVAVNDKLGLGSGVANGRGDQTSCDLSLTYDLVGIAVRRRARFGTDRSWKPLEQKIELDPDFSDPSGPVLDGTFAPQVLNKTWDVDVRIEGQPAPKKLLLNAAAPYEFTVSNPEGDEELVRAHPSWPCCHEPDDKDLEGLFHRIHWRAVDAGASLGAPVAGRFSDSISTLRFLRDAWTHPAGFGGLAPATIVASVAMGEPGVLARADFDEDAALCSIRLAWPRAALVTIVLFDGAGEEVGRKELGASSATFQTFLLGARGPVRRLELRAALPAGAAPGGIATAPAGALVEVDEIAYIGLRDYLDLLVAAEACDGGTPGGLQGSGKLALLPNHDYEIALTTRVTVAHPSTPAASADVEEFVYVRTKGLPGLNAVTRVGEEIEPYVRSAYAGGRGGLVYREEPVALAFAEGFHVAVPLAVRPPGSAEEHTTLLRMQMLVTPDLAASKGTVFTTTAEDWIVAHRGTGVPPVVDGGIVWQPVLSAAATRSSGMRSADPFKARLAVLTQRPAVTCDLGDPQQVIGTVLVAPPVGGGPDPAATPPGSAELWPAGTRFTAHVRVEGAPFVDRRPFVEGDETALTPAVLGGPGSMASWSVEEGRLRVVGAGQRLGMFGEPVWDHVTVLCGIVPGAASAGVGFGLPPGGAASRGLFACVEAGAGGGPARLVIRRRTAGGPLVEVAAVALGAGIGAGSDPIPLEVTSFDDRLRASVGEAVVEIDRDEMREGRLCLTADGPAAFASLQVRGLDMYAYRFGVSRYRSFEEHIGSWSGRIHSLAPHALGLGTTTATVAELWSATRSDVVAAMAPGASSADRERVFSTWSAALGLALKDDVTALEVSRYVDGALTRALLIESPEPLDFTEEIAATLVVRRRGGLGPPAQPQPTQPALPLPFPRPPRARTGARRPRRPLSERLELVARAGARPLVRAAGLPPVDETILDVEIVEDDVRLWLHPALANAGRLAVIVVAAGGDAALYGGLVRPPFLPGNPAILQASPSGPLGPLPAGSDLADELAYAQPGTVLLASKDLLDLIGRWSGQPLEVDVEIDVEILQNGDGRRALIIPVIGTATPGLAAEPHRLTFSLSRTRWQTTDAHDALNTYARSATLALDL